MNRVREGDADSRRMGGWAVFVRDGNAERGAVVAVGADGADGDVKRGKMVIGQEPCKEVMGWGFS